MAAPVESIVAIHQMEAGTGTSRDRATPAPGLKTEFAVDSAEEAWMPATPARILERPMSYQGI
jgi:hypothetical protein